MKIPSSTKSLDRISKYINETPLRKSDRLSSSNQNVFLKLENLQKTGSFKARGALNKVYSSNLDDNEVVAASSGNHGSAVSYALSTKNLSGRIYVPNAAKKSKIEKIQSYGSEVIRFGNDCLDAEYEAIKYSKENDCEFISPYNDLDVISGQGTLGVEIYNQLPDIDAVFVTVGGGGLISGVAHYLKSKNPLIKVFGCSPVNSSIMINSLEENEIINSESKETLSDGSAGGVEEGSITHKICKKYIDSTCLVSEGEIALQIIQAMDNDKIIIEGAAAVAIAAYLKMSEEVKDLKNIVIIVCGGNIGNNTLKSIL
jgi:threonine dehydratase